jgi:hypothetical protein
MYELSSAVLKIWRSNPTIRRTQKHGVAQLLLVDTTDPPGFDFLDSRARHREIELATSYELFLSAVASRDLAAINTARSRRPWPTL